MSSQYKKEIYSKTASSIEKKIMLENQNKIVQIQPKKKPKTELINNQRKIYKTSTTFLIKATPNFDKNNFISKSNSSNDLFPINLIREEFNQFYDESYDTYRKSFDDVVPINEMLIFDYFEDADVAKSTKSSYSNIDAKSNSLNLQQDLNEIPEKREYELKFINRGEVIRKSYINKLKNSNIWECEKPKSHNSLIIFDWDDTLLCSSYLTPEGIFKDDMVFSEKELNKLSSLDETVFKILSFAIENSSTYIITNAAPGWVEYSAERFYPKTNVILKKVTIVSARGEYEKKFPGDSKQWKVQAFLETTRTLNLNLVTNLICLGDSVIEMEAAHILASKFSKAYIKTVKFKEAPKPEELIKQLGTVYDQLNTIFCSVKNLTIRVERKKKKVEK